MNNHSAVNEKSSNSYNYKKDEKDEASSTEEESQCFHRKVTYKNSQDNKTKSPEQKKVSNDTLDQRSSASLENSFDSGIESLSVISDERKSKSAGEFYFANDTLSKQRIIDQLSSDRSPLFCIRSLEELEKHDLIQQVWLENGRLRTREGRLFIDEPLTLIFDLTNMIPSEIASFNEMIQVEPKFNDKPLGDHVKRVFLVNKAMLYGKQITNPDLWRRLGQMTKKAIPEADSFPNSITDEALLSQQTTKKISTRKFHKIIDCSVSDEWHFLLFGGITFNEQGEFIFSEGALAHLGDDTHLVLKNAPWDNADFKESIATALRAGGFEANRQWVMFSNNTTFTREDVSTSELDNLKSQLLKKNDIFRSEKAFVCINSSSIENLKGSISVGSRLI
ncbi:MAG: hypothetical protein KAG53_06295, partial [Endozoicomonadaceae bacterium]|nr:hypothetical protein [Endozoicomonadaceae bacterium]